MATELHEVGPGAVSKSPKRKVAMTRATKYLLTITLVLGGGSAAVSASPVIDFMTGSGGFGGTLNIGANVSGSGLFINSLTISGAAMNNGVYDVDGAAVCADAIGGCGVLSFDENLNTITIVGTVPGLGILGPLGPVTLLSGDISGGLNVLINNGVTGSVTLSGEDTKAPDLLIAIGENPTTPFTYSGFVTAVNGTGKGSPYTGLSSDITNSTAVPEPGSLTLLAAGIGGLLHRVRRRA